MSEVDYFVAVGAHPLLHGVKVLLEMVRTPVIVDVAVYAVRVIGSKKPDAPSLSRGWSLGASRLMYNFS